MSFRTLRSPAVSSPNYGKCLFSGETPSNFQFKGAFRFTRASKALRPSRFSQLLTLEPFYPGLSLPAPRPLVGNIVPHLAKPCHFVPKIMGKFVTKIMGKLRTLLSPAISCPNLWEDDFPLGKLSFQKRALCGALLYPHTEFCLTPQTPMNKGQWIELALMRRFRGGLLFKARGLLYHSTLGRE